MKSTWLLVSVLAAAACTVDPAEDGENDDFLDDGKSDTGHLAEGSPDALGVLRVANEVGYQALLGDVGLASAAALNIAGYRHGDDLSTIDDDEVFDTLVELDRVPYVGPIAFDQMLAYAHRQGFVAPSPNTPTPASMFELSNCSPMSFDEIVSHFPPGSTRTPFSSALHVGTRTRGICDAVTGCPAWTDAPVKLQKQWYADDGVRYELPATGPSELYASGGYVLFQLLGTTNGAPIRIDCGSFHRGGTDSDSCLPKLDTSLGGFELVLANEIEPPPQNDSGATTAYQRRIHPVWQGQICADGLVEFVTQTFEPGAPGFLDVKNQNQIAIRGQL